MTGKLRNANIASSVMNELKKRNLKMRSRRHFIVISVLTAASLALAVVATVYLVGFTILQIRHRAVLEYLGFGAPGFGQFLQVFPWLWLILAAISLLAVIFLLRRYDFSYKTTWYGLLIGVVAALVLTGTALAVADVDLPGKPLPPAEVGTSDNSAEKPLAGKIVGVVVNTTDTTLTVRLLSHEEIVVNTDDQTIGLKPSGLRVGQKVVVLGDWQDGQFNARAIRSVGQVIKNRERNW